MYVLPFWALAAAFKVLSLWTLFANFSIDSFGLYQSTFFIIQTTLICFVVAFFSIKFTSAVWKPREQSNWRRIIICFSFLVPPLCWHLYRDFQLFNWLNNMSNTALTDQQLEQMHNYFWVGTPFGSNLHGVFYTSVEMVAGPVFEEVIFTGFLVNLIGKKLGIVTAILTVPLIFTLVHILEQGFGMHLIPILICGFSFICIRLVSGNLLYSVISHMLMNTLFLLPAWVEAYYFFHHGR